MQYLRKMISLMHKNHFNKLITTSTPVNISSLIVKPNIKLMKSIQFKLKHDHLAKNKANKWVKI